MSAVAPSKPPVVEEVVAAYTVPSWSQLSSPLGGGPNVDREYVPELRWPASVRTFERMSTDSQLSGLYRGTTFPIRRYVWGIDPNGAPQKIVDAVLKDFNLQLIDDAWNARQTGKGKPVPRASNGFTIDRHIADALKALRFGNQFFDLYGQVGDDLLWHPLKVSPIAHWTVGQIRQDQHGELLWIKQLTGGAPMIDASRLVPYVFDKDPGDWAGRSGYRACYREWLLKDRLLRVDLRNHEKGGGVLLPIAPENATTETRQQLGQLAASYAAGGGGSLPAGTNPVFLRATGSDVIGSVNRHDEAMAREWLQMFQTLGSSASGNRALGQAFIHWFGIAQEAIASWARDTFNEDIIERYVTWNFGADAEFAPRLAFKRPEDDNPVNDLTAAAQTPPGDAAAAAMVDANGRLVVDEHGDPVIISSTRTRFGGIVLDDETRHELLEAHAAYEQWARLSPQRTRAAAAEPSPPRPLGVRTAITPAVSAVPVPARTLRRDPTEVEARAAVDFKQLDANWQSAIDQLIAKWKTVRSDQIVELAAQIAAADGDLGTLAALTATVAGGDAIGAQLKTMAQTGAGEAVTEAKKQGVIDAAVPSLADLEAELAARAGALAQLLTSALSQAAAAKAVQLTGGALTADDVAAQVTDYLNGLSDAYLSDQLGGALSAAQNAGRLAAMGSNNASSFYASELLDTNTCEPCAEVDGTEYATAADAAADYPAGGYRDCQGGPRCRGTVVAVYAESEPTS